MGVVDEGLFDILHVRAAAGEDDAAQELVVVVVGYLVPHVLDNLLQSSLHNLNELAALHVAVVVDGIFHQVVDVVVLRVGRAILQLHLLRVALLHLQGGYVLGDIVASQWDDGEVAQDVLAIDRDGGGVVADVDEGAARAFLCLGQHAFGQGEWRQIHLGHADAGHVKALVEVAVEGLAPQDVEEVPLQVGGLYAHGVELILRVNLVLLHGGVEYLLVLIAHVAVGVHQLNDHLLSDAGLGGQVFGDDVAHTSDGLPAHADIDLRDLRLELVLQFLDDVSQALGRLVDVIHIAFTDEGCRVLLHHGEHGDAAVEVLLSRDAGHLG